MALDARASISIWQIAFFVPALIASIFLCVRHGFGRSSGWIFLIFVSLFRLAGASAQLASYSFPSEGVFIAAAILSSFGLSALLVATMGLLARVTDSINRHINGPLRLAHYHFVLVVLVVGLIVTIIGNTQIDPDPVTFTLSVPALTKAGIAVFLLVWLLIAFIAVLVIKDVSNAATEERKLAWVAAIALPFLLIRLIYAALAAFINDGNFNLFDSSVEIVWTLAVIEECIVVFFYLVVGFNVPKLGIEERGNIQTGGKYSDSRFERVWKGGPISSAIGLCFGSWKEPKHHAGGVQQPMEPAAPAKTHYVETKPVEAHV